MSERSDLSHHQGEDEKVDVYKQEQEPRLYRVILHNDHYTTMEFVIMVLMNIFHKGAAEATRVMLDVHRKGHGICGIYPYDIAVTKTNQVRQMARINDHPLQCSYEPI